MSLRVLIFGTCYIDTPERKQLTQQWADLHGALNYPACDLMLVDSNSPLEFTLCFRSWGMRPNRKFYSFPDNIGHLSRNGPNGPASGGRDGWGRAFCKGLEIAVSEGYDYVVHIEGDSLFRLPVRPIIEQMQCDGVDCLSVPVEGTRRKEVGWVETGLMFFDVRYVADSGFIRKYDWPNRKPNPTPEVIIHRILGPSLKMMPWKAERGDKSQITVDNVTQLDWVTHCHDSCHESQQIYDRFVESALA
jgi:hypothetical protein